MQLRAASDGTEQLEPVCMRDGSRLKQNDLELFVLQSLAQEFAYTRAVDA